MDRSTHKAGSASATMPNTFSGGVTLSVSPQDLTQDALIASAPRTQTDGMTLPTLGGIALLAKLGQGGMGAVYYGVHPRLKKEVAVKVLPFHLAAQQPQMVERFFREAQIAAKVQSQHLVTVTDVNKEGGLAYLVMEFVSGKSAGAYLKEIKLKGDTGLSEAIALDICIAASEGLAAAHAEGIIHRDVKPDNIMVPKVKGGEQLNFKAAMLADLGLARSDEMGQSLTGAQTCMGTPGYLSPEQAKDAKSCGKPADVFSMGATLYALLCGAAPFTGNSLMEVLLETTQKPHKPISRFRGDVSKATAETIERCLSKFANKRFADATVLLQALKVCRTALNQPDATAAHQAMQQTRQQIKTINVAPIQAPGRIARSPAPRTADLEKKPAEKHIPWILAGTVVLVLAGGGILYGKHQTSPPETGSGSVASHPPSVTTVTTAIPVTTNTSTNTVLDLGGGIKMDLVQVPAGTLEVSVDGKRTFQTFYMGKYPVTVAQFRRFVAQSGYKTDAEKQGTGHALVNRKMVDAPGVSWKNPGFHQEDNEPVVMVSGVDAREFSQWASVVGGKIIKLPAAVAYEYAARGSKSWDYPWGNAWDGTKANHADLALKASGLAPVDLQYSNDNDGHTFTAPVGSYDNASWCGAMDLSGNVWQLCEHKGPGKDTSDTGILICGGAWNSSPGECGVNNNHRRQLQDFRSSYIGFRVISVFPRKPFGEH